MLLSPSDNFPRSIIPPPSSGQNSGSARMVDNSPPKFSGPKAPKPRKIGRRRAFFGLSAKENEGPEQVFSKGSHKNDVQFLMKNVGCQKKVSNTLAFCPWSLGIWYMKTIFDIPRGARRKILVIIRMVDNSPPPPPRWLRGGGIIIRGQ